MAEVPCRGVPELHDPRGDESERVYSWRLHVLIEAGFPVPLAEKLAASDADLHQAVELTSIGCEPKTVAAILL